MPEDDLKALATDIKAHGLHTSIVVYQGKVIDGWHRYRACQIAQVNPRTIEYKGSDPRAYVESANEHRRHMTASQRAIAKVALKPVTQTSTKAWRDAVKLAGIKLGFRWHDLRHTWASWHAQDGTPLNVLQELGAWSSNEMVQRYAHLATKHLSAWVDGHVGLGSAGLRDEIPTLKEKATARVA